MSEFGCVIQQLCSGPHRIIMKMNEVTHMTAPGTLPGTEKTLNTWELVRMVNCWIPRIKCTIYVALGWPKSLFRSFWQHLMEEPKWTFGPTQYYIITFFMGPYLGQEGKLFCISVIHVPNTVNQYMVNTVHMCWWKPTKHQGCSPFLAKPVCSNGIFTVFLITDFHLQLLNLDPHPKLFRSLPLEQR